ncbi:hypothetical protein BAE44_0002680, partial [Dichanthelium oligosanthes]
LPRTRVRPGAGAAPRAGGGMGTAGSGSEQDSHEILQGGAVQVHPSSPMLASTG